MKLNLLADVSKFSTGINTADKEAKGLSGKMEKYGKRMAKAFALAAAAAGAMAIKIGIDSVKSASDLNEEIGKAEVIFGDVSDEIMAFAKTAARALGFSRVEAARFSFLLATISISAAGAVGVLDLLENPSSALKPEKLSAAIAKPEVQPMASMMSVFFTIGTL
jgi:hypothetical protein